MNSFLLFGQSENLRVSKLEGYDIEIKIPYYQNTMMYIARYFGSSKILVDTLSIDAQGAGRIKGNHALQQGVYVLLNPEKEMLLDFLVDDQQHFFITINLSDNAPSAFEFKNSDVNILYKSYLDYTNNLYAQKENLKAHIGEVKTQEQYDSINRYIYNIDTVLFNFNERIINEQPKSLWAVLLKAMKEPILPYELQHPATGRDSIAAKKYKKDHYWDGVEFWNDRLVFTPFFLGRVNKYFSQIVGFNTQEIIHSIDDMLGKAVNTEPMMELLLTDLIQGTTSHRYKFDDSVYVHLFERYVAPKTYHWMSDIQRNTIAEKAYYLMGKMIGSAAAQIELPDLKGDRKSLYASNAKYTVVCFWDPTCSHCLETLPKLDSLYRTKLKKAGVEIFAVATESGNTLNDWKNYIETHHLQHWTNVYCSAIEEAEQIKKQGKSLSELYDIWFYPAFFVLDNEKRFKAKKLTYPQLVDFLNIQLK